MKSLPEKFRTRVVDDMLDKLDLSELVGPINERRELYRETVAALVREHVGADLAALARHGCVITSSGLVLYPEGHNGRTRNYVVGGDGGMLLRWSVLPPNGQESWGGLDSPSDLVFPRTWNPNSGIPRGTPAAVDDALYPLAVECEADRKAVEAVRTEHADKLRRALAACRTIVDAERVWPGTPKLWAAWRAQHPEYGRPRIDWDAMIDEMRGIPVGWPRGDSDAA